MTQKGKKRRANYHHGNLPAALIDVARRLIVERGPHGFSLVEAATLAGVSPAAPYRHFANRDALLASVAISGYERFARDLSVAWREGQPDPYTAFMRMGEVYLSFAQTDRASYIAMFEAGLSGDEVEGLKEAGDRAFAALTIAAKALGGVKPDGQPISPEMMGSHIWAMSHGLATLCSIPRKGQDMPATRDVHALLASAMQIYLKGLGIEFEPPEKG